MRPPGLILAGGRSSRMGANKALLPLGSKSILAHLIGRFAPQVSSISMNAPAALPGFEFIARIDDTVAGQIGPLAGILTGMRHYADMAPSVSHFVSVPCDSPFVPLDLVARLSETGLDSETIVIASSHSRRHPVFGLWPVALADDLQAWLVDGDNRRINAFLDRHRVKTLDFPPHETAGGKIDPFFNINTPEELIEAEAFIGVLE